MDKARGRHGKASRPEHFDHRPVRRNVTKAEALATTNARTRVRAESSRQGQRENRPPIYRGFIGHTKLLAPHRDARCDIATDNCAKCLISIVPMGRKDDVKRIAIPPLKWRAIIESPYRDKNVIDFLAT